MNGRIRVAMLAVLGMAMFTSMIGGAAAVGAEACPNARVRPGRSTIAVATSATLCLINGVRQTHHLPSFQMNGALRSIAAGQSRDMSVGDYFGDDSPSGLTPMQRVESSAYGRGSSRLDVGQNIAWGEARESTPAAIVASWLGSAPHREILLAPSFHDVGIGISLGAPSQALDHRGAIYTLDLATRGS